MRAQERQEENNIKPGRKLPPDHVHPHLFQNTLVEELLKFLVAVIDTELLKAVVFEIL